VIIGLLVSLPRKRLAATLVALPAIAWASGAVFAASLAPSTWVQLPPIAQAGHSAILAIAVNPVNNQVVLAGTADGSLMRSANGGVTWAPVHTGTSGLLTIAYSSVKTGLVLAGTRGSGALVSKDGGATWAAVKGMDGRAVRSFGFALSFVAAGTDHGVYVSPDGITWRQSGLASTSIGDIAVAAIHDPARLIAGSDASSTVGGTPLFQSIDGGLTWAQMHASISGRFVASLVAGPLPPKINIRPIVVGKNAGLFTSGDNGATFTPKSGGGSLPSTDYTQIAFVTTHFDRYYTASDVGGSTSGGLWRSNDGGRHFTSLAPPMPSVTGLAVSNDEAPILYVATFRPSDQSVVLWAYHDTGATPQGPPATVTPSASGPRTSTPAPAPTSNLRDLLLSSRTPYIAIGLVALIVILLAVVSHFRGRRG
jgi:hypothetical protein